MQDFAGVGKFQEFFCCLPVVLLQEQALVLASAKPRQHPRLNQWLPCAMRLVRVSASVLRCDRRRYYRQGFNDFECFLRRSDHGVEIAEPFMNEGFGEAPLKLLQ